jgi:asparagine synthase (glutamine-hydrolysing)
MCGIAGIISSRSTPLQENLVLRMVSILRHRGPDQSGLYHDDSACLGHARLSIIDLGTGIQPMANEDERFWIVYNGEVFNYIELRPMLEAKGHRFATDTDTEVILHLYEDLGPACLQELNGQFAFAIWDSKEKTLFMARDRVGICPLYYTVRNGRFLFASEIKALFVDPEVPREFDLQSLAQVFTCWTTIGSRTVFSGVHELRPGHFLTVRAGHAPEAQKAYWSLPWYPSEDQWKGTREEAAEELSAILEDAVRIRLRADVPVGAYLSGGLDSSIITSIISRRFDNRLKSFSLGFEEKAFDESSHQREMVEYLGTDHHQVNITNAQVRELFPRVLWHCEKPLLRTSPVPLYLLSGLVRENRFKVVLTGEGSDEVFGGYNIFKEAKVRAFWGRCPESKMRPLLLERLYPYIFQNPSRSRAFLQQFFSVSEADLRNPYMSHQKRWDNTRKCTTFFSDSVHEALGAYNPIDELASLLPDGFSGRDLFGRAQWLEMQIFMSNYLLSSQGDRVGMANSVELRLPFLDHRVVDFAARVPAKWKIRGLQEKYLLKKAYQGQLPEGILKRPKQPYRAPIGQAFFNGGGAGDLLDQALGGSDSLFNPKKVSTLFGKYQDQGRAPASEVQNMAVVGILSTQMLHEQFVRGFGSRLPMPAQPDKIVRRTERT